MTKSMRALLMGAALTGFVAGNAMAQQAPAPSDKDKKDTQQTQAPEAGTKASKSKKEKHACKGQNSCKGKGGCGAAKGKNDCKGQGGCATNGKPEKDNCKTPAEKK